MTGSTTPVSRIPGLGWSTIAWIVSLATIVFAVGFEQGAITGGTPLFHELFHDARHLLGIPCH